VSAAALLSRYLVITANCLVDEFQMGQAKLDSKGTMAEEWTQ